MKALGLGCAFALLLGLGSISTAQEVRPSLPDGPFKTIHLMAAQPAQEAALKVTVEQFNREVEKLGCAECRYHYARMFSGSQTPYTVMLSADWPSRNEYLRVHESSAFAAIYRQNPVFAELEATQFYGRMVEIK